MSNKAQLKKVVGAIVGLAVCANCIGTFYLKEENKALRHEIYIMRHDIRDLRSSMSKMLAEERDEIKEMLAEEQSLFSDTSMDVKVKNTKFEVTMQGTPKTIDSGEKLIAKVIADGKTYVQEADQDYKAVLEVQVTDKIEPIFVIESDTTVRQEVLETQYTSKFFTDEVYSEWLEDDKDTGRVYLNAWIEGDFEEVDIASAEFIVEDTDVKLAPNEAYGVATASSNGGREFPTHEREGTTIPAQIVISPDGENKLTYVGDFSRYMSDGDGTLYNVYFEITTKDGIKYITPDNPIATFYCHGVSKSLNISSEKLMPIIKK